MSTDRIVCIDRYAFPLRDRAFVDDIKAFLDATLAQRMDIDRSACEFGLSRRSLTRMFRKFTGDSRRPEAGSPGIVTSLETRRDGIHWSMRITTLPKCRADSRWAYAAGASSKPNTRSTTGRI